ncbi:hypothetical protein L211DRAFT_846063 [Terfezia boudieri ATCC MYA-4762]|uniref:Uncharacterized protein n=1 Tax=Terfezia boudieri ATCC MYA-4762 TaxID=1051890 RepID=A0A3N4M5N3_9PEZI|nr:hypothetical protein L211DRAFT_846063 [Terfezia boudieri ATCC MYA-4762]
MNAISAVLEEITPIIRYRPLLWLNPAAAGYLKPPGVILQQGNEALWGFTKEMEKHAKRKGWEVLGMWNALYKQIVGMGLIMVRMSSLMCPRDANARCGLGMRVSLLQAMMEYFMR